MSLEFWRLILIICVAVFVVCFVITRIGRFSKNTFYKELHKDELSSKRRGVNSTNFVYFTSGETSKFIKKYVVMKTFTDKYMVCQFARRFEKICYSIIQYSATGRAIGVLKCVELATGDSSRIIALKKRCKYVNVVVNKVDMEEINSSVIKPLSKAKIRAICFFKFLMNFAIFMILRHLFVELFAGPTFSRVFFNGLLNYILIGASFICSLLISIFYKIGYSIASRRARNGGELEYEFI